MNLYMFALVFWGLSCSWERGSGGRTKCRRIPESEGDWKGRIPKCALPQRKKKKLFKTRDLELPFLRDLSQVVRRTPRDTPVPFYTRTSPWPMHGV